MNKRYEQQLKAIKSLERALKKCRELKICIFGVDDGLIWVDSKAKDRIYKLNSVYNDQNHNVVQYTNDAEDDEGGEIEDYGCYVDSGGA